MSRTSEIGVECSEATWSVTFDGTRSEDNITGS